MRTTKILLLLSLIFITSCQPSAQASKTALAKTETAMPTATFQATETPSPTSSPTSTSTSTPTLTPTSAPLDFIAEVILPVSGKTKHGVMIETETIFDESMFVRILKSHPTLNRNFVNGFGQGPEDAILYTAAKIMYLGWKQRGGRDLDNKNKDVTFDEWMLMVAEAQAGKRDWEDVQISILINNLSTPEFKKERSTVWPFYNGDKTPEGVLPIKTLSFLFFDSFNGKNRKIKNYQQLTDNQWNYTELWNGSGPGINYDPSSSTMYFYMSQNFIPSQRSIFTITAPMNYAVAITPGYFNGNRGLNGVNEEELANTFGRKMSSNGGYSTPFVLK